MKQELRQIYRKQRQLINPKLSEHIISELTQLSVFKQAKTVLIYLPIKNEVDTSALLESDKNIVVPITDKENKKIVLSIINKETEFKEGSFGVPEPKIINEVDPKEINLAIIPGVAFDFEGNRIGYGKGYYDKLLKDIKCTKIGLAYSEQIVKNIPAQNHDIPVDLIVTEKGVIVGKYY